MSARGPDFAVAAEKHAPGSPADAVIWEQLDQRTSESVELSAVFLLYMILAAIIAAIGIFLDSYHASPPAVFASRSLKEATRLGRNCCRNSIAKLSTAHSNVARITPAGTDLRRNQWASRTPSGM